ncbi:MAG: GAF domain-containing protein [Acidobacteriota bacterium]
MRKDGKGHGSYVRKVQQDTQQYLQCLLDENEKLRKLMSQAETNNRQLDTELLKLRQDNERLQRETSHWEEEARHLQRQLKAAQEEVERLRQEQGNWRQKFVEIEMESRRYASQYLEVEQHNSNLANLYVANYNLHGTLNRNTVLETIKEIVINLIGSEEVGIYEVNETRSTLNLLASFGLDTAYYQSIPFAASLIGRAISNGEIYLASNNGAISDILPEELHLSACIPLKLEHGIIGAIAIFRLLPQKNGFAELDHELFDMLATQAAMALYCTKLHADITSTVTG